MKYIQFFFLLLLCQWVKAQDTILKTDKTEVTAKVAEITTDEIKFRYFNRLDGPIYTLKKSEVFVIIYQDGTRETFTNAPPAPTSYNRTDISVSSYNKPAPAAPALSYSTPTGTEAKRSGWTYSLN